MKNTNLFLIIAGIVVMIVGCLLSSQSSTINAVDSQFPMTNIPGTVPYHWQYFAGSILIAMGLIFYITDNPR